MSTLEGYGRHMRGGRVRGRSAMAALAIAAAVAILALPSTALAGGYGGSLSLVAQSISKLKGDVVLTCDDVNLSYKYKFAEGKLSGLRSSNPKVASAKTYEGADGMMYLTPFKAGKTTVSYRYKGKSYKAKVVVKGYSKPVKNLSVGSKNYASKFNKGARSTVRWTNVKGKRVNVVPAKGWRVKSVRYLNDRSGKWRSIRNGAKLPSSAVYIDEGKEDGFVLKHSTVSAVLQNDKDDRLSEVLLSFYYQNG